MTAPVGPAAGEVGRHGAASEGAARRKEDDRIAAVRRYDVLDSPPDGAFDRIAMLAARIIGTPIATVAIVDEDRIWFKAHHGIDANEIGRNPGLCASAILQDDPYVIVDAGIDPRTITNPLVAGELGLRFYAAAPLVTSDGFRLGTLNVIDTLPREISPSELATLQDLAAVVVDELELRLAARKGLAARAEIERLGEVLQRSALPPTLPVVPGVDLAGYYHAGSEGLLIGGDFYEVFEARPGTWIAAIGDVCGRGIEAAVLMSSVRSRLRALAQSGHPPARVLQEISESLVQEDHGDRFCTLCYLEVRPAHGQVEITLSSGGHPLPLVRRSDGRVESVGATGPLIGGWPGITLSDTSIVLGEGEMLLLYTDGLVEESGSDSAELESRLRCGLAASSGDSAASALSSVERVMRPFENVRKDDTAMLLLRVSGETR